MNIEYEDLVKIINDKQEEMRLMGNELENQKYNYLKDFFEKIRKGGKSAIKSSDILLACLLTKKQEIDLDTLKEQIDELNYLIEGIDIDNLCDLAVGICDYPEEHIRVCLSSTNNLPNFIRKALLKVLFQNKGIKKKGIKLKTTDDLENFLKLLLLIQKVLDPSQTNWLLALEDGPTNISKTSNSSYVYTYFEELGLSLRRKEKQKQIKLRKYQKMLDILKTVSKKEEITDINPILSLIEDQEIRNAFLWYINTHNQKYYQKLEEEYHSKNENSISKYIIYFQRLGYSFLQFSTELREKFLEMGLDMIKMKMQFLTKLLIDKNQMIKLCSKSSIDTILEIENLLKNSYIDIELLSNNLFLYYEDSSLKNYQENIKVLLEKKINVACLRDKSFIFQKSVLIKKNIELLEQLNLPITQFKDLSMLKEENLVEKVASFIEVGLEVEIKNNPDILNSDMNLAKRIVIARMIEESIFDDNGMKECIKEKESFFVPDNKINDYLLDRNHSNYHCQGNIIFPEDDQLEETSQSYILEGIIIPKLRVTGLCIPLNNIIAPSLYSKEEVKKLEKYKKC